jgi:hypothetical protein
MRLAGVAGSGRLEWVAPAYMTNMLSRDIGERLLEKHMARSKGAAPGRVSQVSTRTS